MSRKATLGRKSSLSVQQQRDIILLRENEDVPLRQLAAMYGVSVMTICRIVKRNATMEQGGRQIANQQQTSGQDIRPRIHSAYG